MLFFRLVVAAVALILLHIASCYAASNPELASPAIVINLPSRTLEFYGGNSLVKTYPIAIGKPSTPSPLGNFSIINKEYDPAWYPPKGGNVVPSGPDNPLGYRWMGFLPLYGIHGTNAPWAIGGAVSNGCIRMLEEDVEEIFEIIPYGTPVYITYDRAKIRVNEAQVSIGIYPDIYGYSGVSIGDVRQKLNSYGLGWVISDEGINRLIQEEADTQVVIADFYKLKINGKTMVDRVIGQQGAIYIPVWTVAKILNRNVIWDDQTQTIKVGKFSAPGIVKGDVLCVTPESLQILFGGKVNLTEDKTVEVNFYNVAVNGKDINSEAHLEGDVLAVSALGIAEALGHKPVWDGTLQIMKLQGKVIPVSIIGDQPYIPITQIFEHFKAYVYWNQEAYRIELTYPYIPIRGID